MANMGIATLRLFWHQFTSTPWLCDGLVLGAAVAAISSTCALAFASALMKFPKMSPGSYYSPSTSALLQRVMISYDCPECNALRLYSHLNKPVGYSATLLEFSSDSLLTETIMSFTISFIIVTFAVFLVREMR
ncbi:hypothetical protein M758_5G180100 [Ceratodon purpureus]|uniref:Uncharacterized protein n=1 Tax=Ceratodon purpureus TaxID=3225 RepID=A0A8T0I444_CERPU|nr:hypothetical protein KC19_5G187300 [Ceratodon purpureus]KAG0617305.1 hypothetical protein M758_5G180100 [Ceratodon purpureus]